MFWEKKIKETDIKRINVNFQDYMQTKKHLFPEWETKYEFFRSSEAFTFTRKGFTIRFSQDLREHRVTLRLIRNEKSIAYIGFGECMMETDEYDISNTQKMVEQFAKRRINVGIDEEIDAYMQFLLKNKII